MPPDAAKLVHDMLTAAKRIQRFADGRGFADFAHDELLRSGIERQFEIIGEAMARLLRGHHSIAERITDYRKISSFRNVLIHGYDSVNYEITWSVVQGKLPRLICELEALLPE